MFNNLLYVFSYLLIFLNYTIFSILQFVKPLVVLLQVADGEKPTMGYIYEGMDRAKEGIKFVYGGDESKYGPIWEIIDRRWHHQRHRPIHAATYYLNPAFHFIPSFKADVEVLNGLYSIMEKKGPASTSQIDLIRELQLFSDPQGETFSRSVAKDSRTTMIPGKNKLQGLILVLCIL